MNKPKFEIVGTHTGRWNSATPNKVNLVTIDYAEVERRVLISYAFPASDGRLEPEYVEVKKYKV